jgi:hypothetical protein
VKIFVQTGAARVPAASCTTIFTAGGVAAAWEGTRVCSERTDGRQ